MSVELRVVGEVVALRPRIDTVGCPASTWPAAAAAILLLSRSCTIIMLNSSGLVIYSLRHKVNKRSDAGRENGD